MFGLFFLFALHVPCFATIAAKDFSRFPEGALRHCAPELNGRLREVGCRIGNFGVDGGHETGEAVA